MLKRVLIMSFILSGILLIALVPVSASQASSNLQVTIVPTVIVPTVVVPGVVTAQPAVPVTGGPTSFTSLILLGLIVVVALAIIVGGLALMSRQPRDNNPP